MTEAHVRVSETIVGKSPSVLIVRTFGGTVGGYRVEAEGFPKFQVGQKLLLFVSHLADGTSEVTGYRQGQYRIVVDQAGAQIAVPTVDAGVRLLTREGLSAARPQPVALDTPSPPGSCVKSPSMVRHRAIAFLLLAALCASLVPAAQLEGCRLCGKLGRCCCFSRLAAAQKAHCAMRGGRSCPMTRPAERPAALRTDRMVPERTSALAALFALHLPEPAGRVAEHGAVFLPLVRLSPPTPPPRALRFA
jgi:hypothetical protein